MKNLLLFLALLPLAATAQTAETMETMEAFKTNAVAPKTPAKFDGDLKTWVDEQVSFPAQAVAMGVTGTVDVSFVVKGDGSITWVQPRSDVPNPFLFLELKRALLDSPKWSPARDAKDKPVVITVSFSYDFTPKLDEADRAKMVVATSVAAPHFADYEIMASMANFGRYIDEGYVVPKELKKKDYEYRITLGFTVCADGAARDVKVTGCDNSTIEQSVVDLIAKSHWSVALINGQPRDYYMQAAMVLSGDKQGKIDDYSFVEKQQPRFQRGTNDMKAFFDYMIMSIGPVAPPSDGEATVKLRFVIEKDGSITDISIVETNDNYFAQRAVEALKKSPKWEPGVLRGEKVRVAYVLPIKIHKKY